MKYNIVIVFVLFFLGCNQKSDSEETTTKQESQVDTVTTKKQTPLFNPETKLFIWKATPDYKKVRNTEAGPSLQNADTLIKGLNELYENVFLEKLKISGDTIYTMIKDATYLAEQMGSTGAEIYVADVVLNLTAVKGIKYVNIDMAEGSHMQPGVWSLDNFSKYTEAK
jgi:hypothetical protein